MHQQLTNPPPDDPLEQALSEALAVLETDGEQALERFLAERPDHAERLREALADLHGADLLHRPATDLPSQLGDFRLGQQLGAGGMGIVYEAEQVSLGRRVALKVVRPELLFFDGARERFRREIEAVARLEHPAIVPILATGTAAGIPYYAMPLLRGRSAEAVVAVLAARAGVSLAGSDLRATLGPCLDDSATDPDGTFVGPFWTVAVRLVRKAALGIQHAHARGVLHRDLKPSNVMFTADGRAIVLDFGLALARGDARLTRTGLQAGSPAYMAPEQVRGEPADERTDVYGLAATLYCLLGLQPPFVLGNPEQLQSRILAGLRVPLRAAALPTELCVVLDTAMDVDRLRRYATAQAFADDLQAVLEGRPILARRLPVSVRLRRLALRHRAWATAVAALLVFAIVLPTVLLWQQQQANVALSLQAERADRGVDVSIDAVERLLLSVASDRMRNLPAAQEVAADMLQHAIGLFDQLAADPARQERAQRLRHRAMSRLAEVQGGLGLLVEAEATERASLRLMGDGDLPPDWRLERARSRRMIAETLTKRGERAEVDDLVGGALADLATLSGIELQDKVQRESALCQGLLASQAAWRGDATVEEAALRAAVEASARGAKDPTGHLTHGMAMVNLSRFLKQRKQHGEALQLTFAAERSAELAGDRELGWPIPRSVRAAALHERGRILQDTGKSDAAIEVYTATMAIVSGLVADYPNEASVRRLRAATSNNLGILWVAKKQFSTARPLFLVAVQDQLEVQRLNPRDKDAARFLASHRRSLSVCLRELGDFPALAPLSRELGAMADVRELPAFAARNLLRCADATSGMAADDLRREALDLLVEAVRRGDTVSGDDPLYVPLRDEPRFQELVQGAGK